MTNSVTILRSGIIFLPSFLCLSSHIYSYIHIDSYLYILYHLYLCHREHDDKFYMTKQKLTHLFVSIMSCGFCLACVPTSPTSQETDTSLAKSALKHHRVLYFHVFDIFLISFCSGRYHEISLRKTVLDNIMMTSEMVIDDGTVEPGPPVVYCGEPNKANEMSYKRSWSYYINLYQYQYVSYNINLYSSNLDYTRSYYININFYHTISYYLPLAKTIVNGISRILKWRYSTPYFRPYFGGISPEI